MKLRNAFLVLITAFAAMLAMAVPANAAIIGYGDSWYYDGVRIESKTAGVTGVGGAGHARIWGFHLRADGDVGTLEGGCTSGNHAADVQVWMERDNGSFIAGGPNRWLCASEDYHKYQDLGGDGPIVDCSNTWVYVKWKMYDNGGADSNGQFRYRPCSLPA